MLTIIRLLSDLLWYLHLRRIDLCVLWSACHQNAHDLEHAKLAFAAHAFHDHAWLTLSNPEITRIIDRLK